jgi:hypothetical protein
METTTTTTKEKLNKTNYVKSYPIFNKLPLNNTQLKLIELVLSYQMANRECFLNRKDIADYLKLKNARTVNDLILILKKAGYISTNQKHNLKINSGIMSGGSSSTIIVNLEFIFDILENKTTNEIAPVIAPIETVIEVIQEEEIVAEIAPIQAEEQVEVIDWLSIIKDKQVEVIEKEETIIDKLTFGKASIKLNNMVYSEFLNKPYSKPIVIKEIKKGIADGTLTLENYSDDYIRGLLNNSNNN